MLHINNDMFYFVKQQRLSRVQRPFCISVRRKREDKVIRVWRDKLQESLHDKATHGQMFDYSDRILLDELPEVCEDPVIISEVFLNTLFLTSSFFLQGNL